MDRVPRPELRMLENWESLNDSEKRAVVNMVRRAYRLRPLSEWPFWVVYSVYTEECWEEAGIFRLAMKRPVWRIFESSCKKIKPVPRSPDEPDDAPTPGPRNRDSRRKSVAPKMLVF